MMKHTRSDKKNRSFSSYKLNILRPVEFNQSIQPSDTIVFIHPPKTGGTNLCHVTDALSKRNEGFKATRFPVPRIPDQSPGLISEHWIGGLKSALTTLSANPDFCKEINFISGHFPIGLHTHLEQAVKYIALVRDPVERAISSTNFDYQRGYVDINHAEKYLLESDIDNPQTRMLAGQDYMSGICNEDVLEQAKRNINEHFLLIGITEDTNSFIQILASIQGWGSLALSKAQVTGEKAIINPSEEILTQLASKHRFDCLLYEWVKARWLQWKETFVNDSQPYSSADTEEKILCITHDFSTTHEPIYLTESEIVKYNAQSSTEVIEVSQNHTELADKTQNSAARSRSETTFLSACGRHLFWPVSIAVVTVAIGAYLLSDESDASSFGKTFK